jgi:hypothetical protein
VNAIITRPRWPGACTNTSNDCSLALLGAAQDRVELVHAVARHEGSQQRHGRTHDRQIDVKIGSRESEQRADVAAREHHRVDFQAIGGVPEHDDERRDAAIADQAAHDAGGVATIERRVDDLDELRRGALSPAVEVRGQLAADLFGEGFDVGNEVGKRQVFQELAYRPLQ